jgi:hypothetical protein
MKNAARPSTVQTSGLRGALRWLSAVLSASRRSRSAGFDRLAREEMKIRARIANFDGGDRLARDVLYDRQAGL